MQEKNKKLNIVFFGTPKLTIPILDELEKSGYAPKVVVTMPDRPMGRKMIITPPAAKVWALAHNVSVLQPEKIDAEFLENLKSYNVDLGVVVAYGKILPQTLIDLPKFGLINVHYSLLPKYRGATPVESAILTGDEKTGVTIQKLVFKLDAGAVLAQTETPIGKDEKADELLERLNEISKSMLVETISQIENDTAKEKEQDESAATHCGKINKEDGEINLEDDPEILYRKFRAYYGWPNIYFFDSNNKRVIIKDAKFEDGKFIPTRVILEGKKEQDYTPHP